MSGKTYLSSGKIALLTLVSLYTESRWPAQSVQPVLSFVIRHLVSGPRNNPSFTVSLAALSEATIKAPSTVPGRSIFDLLLKKLWDIDSYDALHTFITELQQLLADPKDVAKLVRVDGKASYLSKNSVLGIFVRRTALEFQRLSFNESLELWKSFVRFRAPTASAWTKKRVSNMTFDRELEIFRGGEFMERHLYGSAEDNKNAKTTSATDDIERLLEFQVDAMQRLGARCSDEMYAKVRQVMQTARSTPALYYYVEYLNSWRAGDYPGSFDNLHRYFDYTMQNRDRQFYQYALLNLAILQADFGCHRESILAMQETINTARENKDMACLNFALSWIYHFHKSHPEDCPEIIASRMERESLQFLKVKAKDVGMHQLHSMSYLSEARQFLSTGDSVPLAMESLLKSSHLNITRYIPTAIGSQMLLQSGIFSRLGVSYLSTLNCELYMLKYGKGGPLEDVAKTHCRSAYLLATKGRFDEALQRLDGIDAESLRTLRVYQYWATYVLLIKLLRAIHHGEHTTAEVLIQQLDSARTFAGDMALEVDICRVQLQIRRGNLGAAFNSVLAIHADLETAKGDIANRVRTLILKVHILVKSGRATKGLSIIVRAAAIAWRSRLMPQTYWAVYTLGIVLNDLGEFGVAWTLLDGIMPKVLECEDVVLNAGCTSCMADSAVGIAGEKGRAGGKEGERERREWLNRGLEMVGLSFDEYARLGDKVAQAELMSKKARLHHYLENTGLRNDAAAVCLELKKAS